MLLCFSLPPLLSPCLVKEILYISLKIFSSVLFQTFSLFTLVRISWRVCDFSYVLVSKLAISLVGNHLYSSQFYFYPAKCLSILHIYFRKTRCKVYCKTLLHVLYSRFIGGLLAENTRSWGGDQCGSSSHSSPLGVRLHHGGYRLGRAEGAANGACYKAISQNNP